MTKENSECASDVRLAEVRKCVIDLFEGIADAEDFLNPLYMGTALHLATLLSIDESMVPTEGRWILHKGTTQ